MGGNDFATTVLNRLPLLWLLGNQGPLAGIDPFEITSIVGLGSLSGNIGKVGNTVCLDGLGGHGAGLDKPMVCDRCTHSEEAEGLPSSVGILGSPLLCVLCPPGTKDNPGKLSTPLSLLGSKGPAAG